jgi:hypothetical protein
VVATLALAVSSAAALASWKARPARAPAGETAGDPDELRGRLEELDGRVSVLARQVDLLKAGLSVRAVAQARGGALQGGSGGTDQVNAAQVVALQLRLEELERIAAGYIRKQAEKAEAAPPSPAALAEAAQKVLDRNAPAEERRAALSLLRPRDGRPDGRTPEVTTAMLELVHSPSTPSRLRARIVSDLEGVTHPFLKEPLTTLLTRDTDADTREQAVEALRGFYDDAEVRSLITRVKDTDPDRKVRSEAEKRLARWAAEQNR